MKARHILGIISLCFIFAFIFWRIDVNYHPSRPLHSLVDTTFTPILEHSSIDTMDTSIAHDSSDLKIIAGIDSIAYNHKIVLLKQKNDYTYDTNKWYEMKIAPGKYGKSKITDSGLVKWGRNKNYPINISWGSVNTIDNNEWGRPHAIRPILSEDSTNSIDSYWYHGIIIPKDSIQYHYTSSKNGNYIDSIEWIIMIDSTNHISMNKTIKELYYGNYLNGSPIPIWHDAYLYKTQDSAGVMSYYLEICNCWSNLTPIDWYFLKRKGSQTIIVNRSL